MHLEYMRIAMELAQKGIGYVSPNPLVGAVIVKDGLIIGEGYHEVYGGPHAEINAFNNATDDVRESTMYVTLEPCSHYGKTPPCANAIVQKGISKVVIGMKDPNPIVSGRGIKILKDNGIEVVTGILEQEIKELNEIFIKYITTKLPFCILKTAMTLDGKIAAFTGDSKWITNEKSREYVHQLRHRMSAIMVGIGTVLADDPLLTTRLKNEKGSNPVRIIVDSNGRIPLDSQILSTALDVKTVIAVTEKADNHKIEAILKKGAEVLKVPVKDNKVDLRWLVKVLGEKGIDSLLIEGGSSLNFSALNEGIVDEIISFIAPKIIGGDTAKTPVGGSGKEYIRNAFMLENIKVSRFDDDIMIKAYIRKDEQEICSQD